MLSVTRIFLFLAWILSFNSAASADMRAARGYFFDALSAEFDIILENIPIGVLQDPPRSSAAQFEMLYDWFRNAISSQDTQLAIRALRVRWALVFHEYQAFAETFQLEAGSNESARVQQAWNSILETDVSNVLQLSDQNPYRRIDFALFMYAAGEGLSAILPVMALVERSCEAENFQEACADLGPRAAIVSRMGIIGVADGDYDLLQIVNDGLLRQSGSGLLMQCLNNEVWYHILASGRPYELFFPADICLETLRLWDDGSFHTRSSRSTVEESLLAVLPGEFREPGLSSRDLILQIAQSLVLGSDFLGIESETVEDMLTPAQTFVLGFVVGGMSEDRDPFGASTDAVAHLEEIVAQQSLREFYSDGCFGVILPQHASRILGSAASEQYQITTTGVAFTRTQREPIYLYLYLYQHAACVLAGFEEGQARRQSVLTLFD